MATIANMTLNLSGQGNIKESSTPLISREEPTMLSSEP